MAVSLIVDWPGGRTDVVPFMGYFTASGRWKALAEELGLTWAPTLVGWAPIDEGNLQAIIAELEMMHEALETRAETGLADVTRQVLDVIRSLRHSTGWKASVG